MNIAVVLCLLHFTNGNTSCHEYRCNVLPKLTQYTLNPIFSDMPKHFHLLTQIFSCIPIFSHIYPNIVIYLPQYFPLLQYFYTHAQYFHTYLNICTFTQTLHTFTPRFSHTYSNSFNHVSQSLLLNFVWVYGGSKSNLPWKKMHTESNVYNSRYGKLQWGKGNVQ